MNDLKKTPYSHNSFPLVVKYLNLPHLRLDQY